MKYSFFWPLLPMTRKGNPTSMTAWAFTYCSARQKKMYSSSTTVALKRRRFRIWYYILLLWCRLSSTVLIVQMYRYSSKNIPVTVVSTVRRVTYVARGTSQAQISSQACSRLFPTKRGTTPFPLESAWREQTIQIRWQSSTSEGRAGIFRAIKIYDGSSG